MTAETVPTLKTAGLWYRTDGILIRDLRSWKAALAATPFHGTPRRNGVFRTPCPLTGAHAPRVITLSRLTAVF